MNNENEGAPALNLSYIFEYFSLEPRQGPGSEVTTLQALSCLTDLPSDVRMADVGCGTGAQTLTLARHVPGTLHAIDLCPLFIDTLRKRLRALGLSARLTVEVKNIENTMFFRLPSILRIPCSLNIPAGSTCDENPNVRHRSREELLRELVDQGYNVNQYKL